MSSNLPITNNNNNEAGIGFTAVDIYDKVVDKEAGWTFAFRTQHQLILPHYLMKRILDFALLPHAVVPLGWNISREDTLYTSMAQTWVLGSINCSNIIKKDKGRIADDSTHWVLENPVPNLSLRDHAHTPFGSFQLALKYQICKNYIESNIASTYCRDTKLLLQQLEHPAAELFLLSEINVSLNKKKDDIIGEIQRYVQSTLSTKVRQLFLYRARYNNVPHRFKSTNPLDKEFLSYPVHDFNTIKHLRYANTRLKRLVEDDYCTLQEQQHYYKFVRALKLAMQDIVYNEGLMKIEAALFQPDYTTWSSAQLNHTRPEYTTWYKPCPFSPIMKIQHLPFCFTAFLSLVFMSVMIYAITVSSFALDLLSQYSIWNDSNATNATNATANATPAMFTTLEEFNALEDQMTMAALLVGALPACVCAFLLCRCHWPILICCCHGNGKVGLYACIRTQRLGFCGAPTLYCCGQCFFLDLSCCWCKRLKDRTKKRSYKKNYHNRCCANGFVFLFFAGPIMAIVVGFLLWIKSVIQINKEALTNNSTWTTANLYMNRGMVTYNTIDGNYGPLCCLIPWFFFLFFTMGVLYVMEKENQPNANHCCALASTKADACFLIHPISFVSTLFFAAICFIYQYVQSMADNSGLRGGGTNGTFEGTYGTHGMYSTHGMFAFNQTHQSSTASTPDFQWTIIVLPFFTVILLVCLGIPCTLKIMDPTYFCNHRGLVLEDGCKVLVSWVVYTAFFLLPAIGFLSAAVGWDCDNNKNTLRYEDSMPGTLSSFFFVVSDSTSLRTLFVTSIALICIPLCLGLWFLGLQDSYW